LALACDDRGSNASGCEPRGAYTEDSWVCCETYLLAGPNGDPCCYDYEWRLGADCAGGADSESGADSDGGGEQVVVDSCCADQ
jgi:hypothetical protein